jgi:hypothetical protein
VYMFAWGVRCIVLAYFVWRCGRNMRRNGNLDTDCADRSDMLRFAGTAQVTASM